MSEFNNKAKDGDGDGFVQDGTEWERPVEEVSVEPETNEEPAEDAPTLVEELAEELDLEASVAEVEESADVISTPSKGKGSKKKQAMAPVSDGVIGTSVDEAPKARVTNQVKEISENTVAIYSARNVRWEGVGKINKGYNIVDKSEADKWIEKLNHVRLASPEEVSRELG
tara:strand:- start:407 stop:916 length:510 start_codon:yes stop_codon:yes gene_type:complete